MENENVELANMPVHRFVGCSEKLDLLFASLCKVQGEMKPAPKVTRNPFFKSRYADLPSVHHSSRALLAKNGLCVCQIINNHELVTILGHSSGQYLTGVLPLSPQRQDPQSLGSFISYMRRYAEMAIIGQSAEEEDDDGNEAGRIHKNEPESRALPETLAFPASSANTEQLSEKQLGRLFAIKHSAGWSNEEMKNFMKMRFQKQSTKELSWDEYSSLCKFMEQHPISKTTIKS